MTGTNASDDDSWFRSAIVWWEPRSEEEIGAEIEADSMPMRSLGSAVYQAVTTAAHCYAIYPHTESPIETQFGGQLAGFLAIRCERAGLPFAMLEGKSESNFESGTILLIAQFQLAGFRFDFALKRAGAERAMILIECDGEEFHSTDEQHANDLKKNAAAKAASLELFRFTGSQIFGDPERCVRSVVEALAQRLSFSKMGSSRNIPAPSWNKRNKGIAGGSATGRSSCSIEIRPV
jgi:very-short-patch-repair endonuclease